MNEKLKDCTDGHCHNEELFEELITRISELEAELIIARKERDNAERRVRRWIKRGEEEHNELLVLREAIKPIMLKDIMRYLNEETKK